MFTPDHRPARARNPRPGGGPSRSGGAWPSPAPRGLVPPRFAQGPAGREAARHLGRAGMRAARAVRAHVAYENGRGGRPASRMRAGRRGISRTSLPHGMQGSADSAPTGGRDAPHIAGGMPRAGAARPLCEARPCRAGRRGAVPAPPRIHPGKAAGWHALHAPSGQHLCRTANPPPTQGPACAGMRPPDEAPTVAHGPAPARSRETPAVTVGFDNPAPRRRQAPCPRLRIPSPPIPGTSTGPCTSCRSPCCPSARRCKSRVVPGRCRTRPCASRGPHGPW